MVARQALSTERLSPLDTTLQDSTQAEWPSIDELEPLSETLGSGEIVRRCSPARSGQVRSWLRGKAHGLNPLVQIGHQGLTPAVAEAVDRALLDHELIKVRVPDRAPVTPRLAALWLHGAIGAEVIQILGRMLILYRAHPDKPRIVLPKPKQETP